MEREDNLVTIRFAKSDEFDTLASLSKKFANENCCNGIVADISISFVDKIVIVALVNKEIIGYCHGKILSETKNRNYASVGDKYYNLDEIYVLPEFRDKKVGQKLFEFTENYAKSMGCKTIRLNAVSKDYNRLLKFYIDILGMEFFSAYLIKRL